MYLVNAVWLFAQVGIVPASLIKINVCDKCHQGDPDLKVKLMVSLMIFFIDDGDDIVTPNADPESLSDG